jgi:hypothetical protein
VFSLLLSDKAVTNVRFGSKADMCSALGDVRFVPIADIEEALRANKSPA